MPPQVREDLLFWKSCLATLEPTRLLPNYKVRNVGWVGDASSSFGMGIIIGKSWAQFSWLPDWANPMNQPKHMIAWAETVAGRLGLLMLFEKRQVAGLSFSCLTDNTTTEGAARKRKSCDFCVNSEWKKVQTFLIKHNCNINLVRVISADNSADRLSRGLDLSKFDKDMITVNIPTDLSTLLYQVFPIARSIENVTTF